MITYYMPTGSWPLRQEYYRALMKHAGYEQGDLDADFLLLPGGTDVGANPVRDLGERDAYNIFRDTDRSVIGICRGFQFMLSENGAPIIPHIPDLTNDVRHLTVTAEWTGQSSWHTTSLGFITNTRHHQGFMEVPKGWEILDKTRDGIIEAAQTVNEFGVQWHPEHPEMYGTPAQDWFIDKMKEIIK